MKITKMKIVFKEARSKVKRKEEVRNMVCMHWNSGFCKQHQCNYVHTDEDCDIHLQGEKCRYNKCKDRQGQTGTDKDKKEQRVTDKDRQGQTGTDRDIQGQAGTNRDRQGQTRTYRNSQGQTGTDRDRQGQTGTERDRQGQTGTSRDNQGQKRDCLCWSLFVPVFPCLVPALSLLVPVCPCPVPGIDWHNW